MASNDVELLTEHFGYPPVSLLDDIINSINILAERALNSVETGLLNAPPASLGFRPPTHIPSSSRDNNPNGLPIAEDAHRHEIESGTHQLETLLCASIDRNFDKFELYVMRNILCVRPDNVRDWIRLSHYDGLDFSHNTLEQQQEADDDEATAEHSKPSVESINRLRRRLQASQKLNCMLHAEKARNELLLEEVRKLVGTVGSPSTRIKEESLDPSQSQSQLQPAENTPAEPQPPLSFLHKNKGILTNSGAESPITTTTDFTLSQLQALRALSGSLRGLMPDLAVSTPPKDKEEEETAEDRSRETSAGSGKTNSNKSWRRERLEYVETATRKHLENVRGLELGKNGEIRDGEWQGEGRKLGEGEVDGLEGLVSLLGSGSGTGGGSGSGGRLVEERIPSSTTRSASVVRDEEDGDGDGGGEDDVDKMDET